MILYLAPLQGFTDYPYRNAYARWFSGIDIAMAPFISALPEGRFKKKEFRDVLPDNNPDFQVIPQIMGNQADDFAIIANRLFELGYPVVNWNLGCPYRMVAKKKKGSGLLCFPDLIYSFLDRVFPLLKGGVSIKMRLGRYSREELNVLAPILNAFPLDEIILHPRTGVQMYDGSVDLEAFDQAIHLFSHRMVYNGDITNISQFQSLKKRYPFIDRWMIGRGILSDPFLPMTLKNGCANLLKNDAVRPEDKSRIVQKFHDDYYQCRLQYLNGPAHLTDRMKAFWSYLYPSFEGGDGFFKKVKKTRDVEAYQRVVSAFFDAGPKWIPD